MLTQQLTFGLVAGEPSGDLLGAELMASIKQQAPDAKFYGVGGPLMLAQGLFSLAPMEPLSVIGLSVIKRLPQLIAMRRQLKRYFLSHPPDAFVGIDVPDFNLGLAQQLRRAGILTTHYVSPSVWAWRQGRIKKIARAVDHMFTLLPFEADFYRAHQVPVTFVGHTLADQIPLQVDQQAARQALALKQGTKISADSQVIALLPGSRLGEINYLAADFIAAAKLCWQQQPQLQFLSAVQNPQCRERLTAIIAEQAPNLPIHIIDGQSRQVMAAADAVLLASGTATLEAMLIKRPMVIAYRLGAVSYRVGKLLIKIPYIGLPNLLAGKQLVPEFIQHQVCPELLAEQLLKLLANEQLTDELTREFTRLHRQLRCQASATTARVLLELIASNPTHSDN